MESEAPLKGFEVAPDWKPVGWWELKTSYSHLEMHMKDGPGSNDPTSVHNYVGSSPRHQVVIQSFVKLPRKLEFGQTYRYVSALSAQVVKSYSTADAHFAWQATVSLNFLSWERTCSNLDTTSSEATLDRLSGSNEAYMQRSHGDAPRINPYGTCSQHGIPPRDSQKAASLRVAWFSAVVHGC